MNKKSLIGIIALTLVLGIAVGGTIAYLVSGVKTVTNTFTVGQVAISLTETNAVSNAKLYNMYPGETADKDPKVTVTKGSNKCYLFVEVVKSTGFDTYLTLAVDETADGGTDGKWIKLVDTSFSAAHKIATGSEVYYKVVENDKNNDQTFNVLKGTTGHTDGYVTMNSTVESLPDDTKVTFKAAAIQYDALGLEAAWGEVSESGTLKTAA